MARAPKPSLRKIGSMPWARVQMSNHLGTSALARAMLSRCATYAQPKTLRNGRSRESVAMGNAARSLM
eukprot:11198979-Lingulodinium_polyedra.AAC.1